MNIYSQVCLILDVGLKIGHLKVIIHIVHNKVWEPGSLTWGLEQLVEQLETFLSEVVPKDFKAHERGVMKERLCEEGQA